MHIHESYHSVHTTRGGLFFCQTGLHQNSKFSCSGTFPSLNWLAWCFRIMPLRYVTEYPPNGQFLWQYPGRGCIGVWKPEASPTGHRHKCLSP